MKIIKKHTILFIATILLISIVFVGIACADSKIIVIDNEEDYIDNFTNPIPEDTLFYIKDGSGWKVPALYNDGTQLCINHNVIIDFTNFTNPENFTGIPIASANDKVGGLFGNVDIESSAITFEIKGLNMSSIKVNSSYARVGGIIGSAYGKLNITNCHLQNCDINGDSFVGGMIGYAEPICITNSTIIDSSVCSKINNDKVGGIAGRLWGGTIMNVTAINCTISGDMDDEGHHSDVGGVCGSLSGTIMDSSAINCTVLSGGFNTGGLLGSLSGKAINCSALNCTVKSTISQIGGLIGTTGTATITSCVTMYCLVSSTNQAVGGLIGDIQSPSTNITNSMVMHSIINSSVAGGALVGMSNGANITDCRVLNCTIKARTHGGVGGAVGVGAFYHLNLTNITIDECNIEGESRIAGLIGCANDCLNVMIENSTVMNSTIKSICNGYGTNVLLGGLVGEADRTVITIADSNVVGCNLSTISCGIGGLISDVDESVFTVINCSVMNSKIDGSYYIGGLIAGAYGAHGVVMYSNVTNCNTDNENTQLCGGINSANANSLYLENCNVYSSNVICGLLNEANNATIVNCGIFDLTYNSTNSKNAGLVNSAKNVTVMDCFVVNCTINASDGPRGCLINYAEDITVENCTVTKCNVNGDYRIGGLIGVAYNATVKNCTVLDCNIHGGPYTGGVAGIASESTITESDITNCTIASNGDNIGGVIGFIPDGTLNITNCTLQNCTISGNTHVGGYVGYADSSVVDIHNCSTVHCTITGGTRVGGMVGFAITTIANKSTVANSTITGGYYVGGFVGYGYSFSVRGAVSFKDCNLTNTSVYGSYADVGGLVGYARSSLSGVAVNDVINCYVTNCIVAGGSNVGGVVGLANSVNGTSVSGITKCYVINSAMSGSRGVGGLVGEILSNNGTMVKNCDENTVMNCAVRGWGDSVHLDCGSHSGQVGCVNQIGYLNTGNETLAEPLISVYSHIFDYPTPLPIAPPYTIITNLTNIGTLNNPKKALCYVVDRTFLSFNPCNGTDEAYSGEVIIGSTTITFTTPIYTGYNFTGWNLTNSHGTMLTDATGNLQANVSGYTNATGCWNYDGLDIVSLYASWTGHEYNNTVSDDNVSFPSNLSISSINFNPNSNVIAVSFKYESPKGNPQTGGATVTTIGDPFTLSATGSLNGTKAVVNFNITTSQMVGFNITDIRLAHYVGTAWTFIKPTYNGLILDNYTFSAEVDSMSPFGVVNYVENSPQVINSGGSHRQSGGTVILPETIAPTPEATLVPIVEQPTPESKPTAQPTQQSPAPFVGLITGLGVAVVLLRLRK